MADDNHGWDGPVTGEGRADGRCGRARAEAPGDEPDADLCERDGRMLGVVLAVAGTLLCSLVVVGHGGCGEAAEALLTCFAAALAYGALWGVASLLAELLYLLACRRDWRPLRSLSPFADGFAGGLGAVVRPAGVLWAALVAGSFAAVTLSAM